MWSRVRKDSHYQENPLLSPLSASLSLLLTFGGSCIMDGLPCGTIVPINPVDTGWLSTDAKSLYVYRLPVSLQTWWKKGGIDVGVFSSFLFVDQTLKEEDPRVDRTRASCLAQWKNKKKRRRRISTLKYKRNWRRRGGANRWPLFVRERFTFARCSPLTQTIGVLIVWPYLVWIALHDLKTSIYIPSISSFFFLFTFYRVEWIEKWRKKKRRIGWLPCISFSFALVFWFSRRTISIKVVRVENELGDMYSIFALRFPFHLDSSTAGGRRSEVKLREKEEAR